MMSYAAAIERLNALGLELYTAPGQPRRKFELDQMRTFMAALGDPQHKFASILIAGTNGKGSTSATVASILACAGYRTGLYTSPHLNRVNERVRVNGRTIPNEEFARLFGQVEEVGGRLVEAGRLPASPSFFETITAIAFLYFAAQGVHTAVLEVGLGGRLDATNIVEPLVSVITDISLDHTEWLGGTIGEIAREKAGILRRRGVMVTLPQHPEANRELGDRALALEVRAVSAAEYIPAFEWEDFPRPGAAIGNRYPLTVFGDEIEIDSPLAGAHQQRNLALAIAAAVELRNNHGYDIKSADIAAGVHRTIWPARLERIAGDGKRAAILLDVGHNPAGAWALRAAVSRLDDGQPLTLVFSCLKDKPVQELAQILCPLFGRVVVTPVDSPRSTPVEELLLAAKVTGSDVEAALDPAAALERALALTPPDGLVVVTGSVYLVGKIRAGLVAENDCEAEALHA
jgi:dihydrofolate synthase/folylpolyglutamate synthase